VPGDGPFSRSWPFLALIDKSKAAQLVPYFLFFRPFIGVDLGLRESGARVVECRTILNVLLLPTRKKGQRRLSRSRSVRVYSVAWDASFHRASPPYEFGRASWSGAVDIARAEQGQSRDSSQRLISTARQLLAQFVGFRVLLARGGFSASGA